MSLLQVFKGQKKHPVFVLANHTSFFDTVLIVAKFPLAGVSIVRTYINAALLKKPLLGTVCRGCQHFPVYFKSAEDGKFTLDKEKFAVVDQRVNEHIKKNGLIAFFPEGQINEQPEKLLNFRYGGMKKALLYNASIYFFVNRGNAKIWPRKDVIGGMPGKVKYTVKCVAKDGCKQLVLDLKKDEKSLEEIGCNSDSPEYKILTNYLQSEMQKSLDEMYFDEDNEMLNKKKKTGVTKEEIMCV